MAAELDPLQAALLGILQGLTEWLPVSSSGHLVLAQHFLGIEVPFFFDLALHLGTLAVLVVFLRHDLLRLLRALAAAPAEARARGWRAALLADPERRLALLLLVALLPTALIGLGLRRPMEGLFAQPRNVALALLLTGALLMATRFAPPPRRAEPRWSDALLIGGVQGFTGYGFSRSGWTIGTGLLRGLDREAAARFSFLLGLPTLLGATLVEADPAALAHAQANLGAYAAGMAAAAVVGYAALAALVYIVRKGALHHFAWYCWAVGAAVLMSLA